MRRTTKLAGLMVAGFVFCATGTVAVAQQRLESRSGIPEEIGKTSLPAVQPAAKDLTEYVLGPNDQIVILGSDIEEIADKPIRITTSGYINLTLGVGRIRAAGMTVAELEEVVTERLKANIRNPEIAINVTELKSQPISVGGAVGAPSLYFLEGQKTLMEVLAMAGGPTPEAGDRVIITRSVANGPIPLATVHTQGDFNIAEVNLRDIQNGKRPQDNIYLMQDDIINVVPTELVYVYGEVNRAGAIPLKERKSISIIEALARAEGTSETAAKKDVRIIRPVGATDRIEIAVNLDDLQKGKIKDMELLPNDILYIPDSYAKGAARRTLDTIIQAATGLAIYR